MIVRAILAALALLSLRASAFSLQGAWEMAYSPFDRDSREYPAFQGVVVPQAVPGYWEDMRDEFAKAGLKAEFRINPLYKVQRPPFRGYAMDTTLPDIRGTFFYRRSLRLDRVAPAVLSFECVRNNVHVWINGAFVGTHRGYSAPFQMPVKGDVLKVGANEIVLAVCNGPVLGYCDYVSGLTSRGLFASTGGIVGDVRLDFKDALPPRAYVTTAADLKTFTVHLLSKEKVTYAILNGGHVCDEGEIAGDITLSTGGMKFWSPECPQLYELVLRAGDRESRQKFGIRRLVARGEKLFLNGEPVYLRGVTEHCYFPKTVHLPRDINYYRMITAKRKTLGFNFVRFHTFVPPVEYLQATDELGMLVHIESPNFTSESEYAEIIDFARTHPSVVIYCTGNETRIDRLAERYLADISEMVHTRTDALFSPMSAMRGIEYFLLSEEGLDPVVKTPFEHNAERMARVARFSDLFTSYALGHVSYESLDWGSSETLNRWGDAYCGKPRLSHEICIDSSYADFSLEKLYPPNSPILKTGVFSGVRENLRARGLLDRADIYFRNSCEWMWRVRKHCFEKLRAADRIAGYDFLGDINTHWHTFGYSVGMMDEFYRLKPGETEKSVRRYNDAAVVLTDLGTDFNVVAGSKRTVTFSISNYARPLASAKLSIRLVRKDGSCVWEASRDCGALPNGCLSTLVKIEIPFPAVTVAEKFLLKASVEGLAENEWELYAFPEVPCVKPAPNITVLETATKEDLLSRLAKGERVVLLGAGPFKSLPASFRIGMAGRTSGHYATVIAPHPIFARFPHEGFCGWQFRRMMHDARAIQLEAGVPYKPIVEVASSVKFPIREAFLFEYQVGKGRLLVCSFNLDPRDPAARALRAAILSYASASHKAAAERITPQQLAAVIDAPLLSAEKNPNRANNVNDPSSLVRAYERAQP